MLNPSNLPSITALPLDCSNSYQTQDGSDITQHANKAIDPDNQSPSSLQPKSFELHECTGQLLAIAVGIGVWTLVGVWIQYF